MKSAEHWHDEGVTNIASTLHRVEARLKDAELPTLEHVQAIYAIYREKARAESAESALAALKAESNKDKSDLDAIRAVFRHGADEDSWKPGTTLSESVAALKAELEQALLPRLAEVQNIYCQSERKELRDENAALKLKMGVVKVEFGRIITHASHLCHCKSIAQEALSQLNESEEKK